MITHRARPARRRLPLAGHLAWSIPAAIAACGGDGTPPSIEASTVRDSAGIRIVENAAPRSPERARLSAEPVVEIPGDGPPDETPLDPVSVFQTESGLIVVGDGNQSGWDAMLVYDADGNFLREIGGSGEGPGELRVNVPRTGRDVPLSRELRTGR